MAMIFILLTISLLFLLRLSNGSVCRSFEQNWPAISEEEFVARCGPGTDRDVALTTRRIISEQLGIPYDHIYPEQNLVVDLGCD